MDVPQLTPQLIESLRTWFHSKDRSVYLAPSTFAFLPGGIGYLSMAFISEISLTASTASVTFSNISQEFRHLILTGQTRSDAVAEVDAVLMRFNGDSGANYDLVQVYGNAATAAGATSRGNTSIFISNCEASLSRGNNFAPVVAWIMDYSRTNAEARLFSLCSLIGNLSADADLFVILRASNWRDTNVVTSITLSLSTGPNFVAGTRFQLYGVL